MVEDNDLLDTTDIKITNVSAAVFKLVLTFVYGGKLPDMDGSTAAQLALAAHLYNIAPLVTKTCKLLTPTDVQDVFPALWVVAYIESPILESHVAKIVQEETSTLMKREEFYELDYKCMDYIASQERLSITELELWKELVKWAQYKVLTNPEKSLRQCAQSVLQYIRLTTFTQEEIIKEVMPSKILTASEIMELLTAVSTNQPWEVPGLCKIQNARGVTDTASKKNESTSSSVECKDASEFGTSSVFTSHGSYNASEILKEETEYRSVSNFTIKPSKDVEIQNFVFRGISILKLGNAPIYKLSCTITVSKIEDGYFRDSRIVQLGGTILGGEEVAFPLKLRNGQLLRLEANSRYNFAVEFLSPHPVFTLSYSGTDSTYYIRMRAPLSVKFNSPIHLLKINYKA